MDSLFDDIQRRPGDLDRASNTTTTWEYLNRSGRPDVAVVRDELDRWFRRFPAGHQAELARRFRTDRRGDSLAPFFELFLHEMVVRFQCDVEVHPTTSVGTCPDFRVTCPNGKTSLLEATVAYEESVPDQGATSRHNDFLEALNRMKDRRFFLSVWIDGDSERPLPARKLRRQIEKRLAQLDPEQIEPDNARPRWKWREGRATIEVEAFPRPRQVRGDPESRSIVAVGHGMRQVGTWEAARDALAKKATRYGDPGVPYVVAVLPVPRLGLRFTRTEAMQALFGAEVVEYSMSLGGVQGGGRATREPNGVWVGRERPLHTRLSAVLILGGLRPWRIVEAEACLYHNPWAKLKYESALCRLPRGVPGESKMEWHGGTSLAQVFELADSWPRTPT